MSNIEKLVDFIMERDEDGKLFDRFVAFLEMGLYCCNNSAEEVKGQAQTIAQHRAETL